MRNLGRRPVPVVRAAQRRAAGTRVERTPRRRSPAVLGLLAVAVLLPLAALGWALLASSWLAVDRLVVTGLSRLSDAQVRAAADVAPGSPLARVDTGKVARAVRRLPPVAAVEVSRSWPGTLRVAVRERTAVAAFAADGTYTLLDAEAVPFATVRELPPGVVRLEAEALRRGDPAVRAALRVHTDLPDDLRRRVRAVRAEHPSHVVLLLADDQQVVWGPPGHTGTKAAAALALLREPGDVLDVTSPDVVVRR